MTVHALERLTDDDCGSTASDGATPSRLDRRGHRLIAQTAAEFVERSRAGARALERRLDAPLAHRALRRPRAARHRRARSITAASGSTKLRIVVGESSARPRRSRRRSARRPVSRSCRMLCFGTEAQKQQYLPRLVSGEIVGAYCLSESGSGSDALGARTRRPAQPDGSWRLNGEKMWTPTAASPTCSSSLPKSMASSSPRSSSSAVFPASRAARKNTRWACTARRRRR